jgi:molybdate transport system substrate-binding protein
MPLRPKETSRPDYRRAGASKATFREPAGLCSHGKPINVVPKNEAACHHRLARRNSAVRGVILVMTLAMVASVNADELLVSAAASLTDAVKEIGARYEKQTGDKLIFNFGGSSLLARQIEEGVPADVFLSADEAQMDRLERASRLERGTRSDLLTNALVIVARQDSPLQINSVADLASSNVSRIAIADPQSVPAGIYARQLLANAGIWERVRDKIVPAENVRAALAVVEAGNADLGIVYTTDTAASQATRGLLDAPTELSPKITYPVAVMANSTHSGAAKRFLAFLKSSEAAEIFQRAGFGVVK